MNPAKGLYQIKLLFSAPVDGVGLSGDSSIYFGYSISEEMSEKAAEWVFEINDYTFTRSGTNAAHPIDNGMAARPTQALYKAGAILENENQEYAAWAIHVNESAMRNANLFDTDVNVSGVTIKDTFDYNQTPKTQTMAPFRDSRLLIESERFAHNDPLDAIDHARWANAYVSLDGVPTAGDGYFTADGETEVYFNIYRISQADIAALWKNYCGFAGAGDFNENELSAGFDNYLQVAASLKKWFTDSPEVVADQNKYPFFKTLQDRLSPLPQNLVRSATIRSDGFELVLEPQATDGYTVIILYRVRLKPGKPGDSFNNRVDILPVARIEGNEKTTWLTRTSGSGTVTAHNEGIVLKKTDAANDALVSSSTTEFTLTRHNEGTGELNIYSSSANTWTLKPENGELQSANLYPQSNTYFKLTEAVSPNGYSAITAPVYFQLQKVNATTYTLIAGTVDEADTTGANRYKFVPFDSADIPNYLAIDDTNRILTIKNTKLPLPPAYDAALRKWVVSVNGANIANDSETKFNALVPDVKTSDRVKFAIEVTNQHDTPLVITDISDYMPAGYTFDGNAPENAGWVKDTSWAFAAANPGHARLKYTTPVTLAAKGESKIIYLTLTAIATGDLSNIAEISAMEDTLGNPIMDRDSTPDTNPNNDTLKDNVIDENGQAGNDEDDHDIAAVNRAATAPVTPPSGGDYTPSPNPGSTVNPNPEVTPPPSAQPEPSPEQNPTPAPSPSPDAGLPPVPPVPHTPNGTLVSSDEGNTFIEFDAFGVPLGEWRYDEEQGIWIFDEYPPLSSLPNTGDDANQPALLFLICMSFMALLAIIRFGRRQPHKA